LVTAADKSQRSAGARVLRTLLTTCVAPACTRAFGERS